MRCGLSTFRPHANPLQQYSAVAARGERSAGHAGQRHALAWGKPHWPRGTNLLSDSSTVLLMRGNRFLIETSLASNQLLSTSPDIKVHPFPGILRIGIPVCLNTDDRGAFRFQPHGRIFRRRHQLQPDLGRNHRDRAQPIQHSFAEPPVRDRLLREYEAAVKRFELQYF